MGLIWKNVVGYEGIYVVSNTGIVKGLARHILCKDRVGNYCIKRIEEKILSTKRNNRGYVQVHLTSGGITSMMLVHRIVAMAFIPNPDNLPQVNHIDEDKNNNCVENLEWCTNMHNRHHGTGIERMAQNHKYDEMGLARSKPIAQYNECGCLVNTWRNAKEACSHYGWGKNALNSCLAGITKSAKGYGWKYIA